MYTSLLDGSEGMYTQVCCTYKFEHVPVKDIVIGKALTMEELTEELP